MPKIRGVKPDFWTDDDIVELSAFARLLYIGLWNYACDNGHVEDRPTQIKLRILPADDVSVAALLAELADKGRIDRADGWVTVPNLGIHQRIDRRYFTTCKRPGCTHPGASGSSETKPSPAGRTRGTRRAHDGDPSGPRVDGDGDGDGETAAAAAGARSSSRDAIDLPGELHVLRSKLTAWTAMRDVSFDHLKPEQADEIVALIHRFGDDRLVENAKNAGAAPGTVQGYLKRWRGLTGPHLVRGPPEPRCAICGRTKSACERAAQTVTPDDRHTFQESA